MKPVILCCHIEIGLQKEIGLCYNYIFKLWITVNGIPVWKLFGQRRLLYVTVNLYIPVY